MVNFSYRDKLIKYFIIDIPINNDEDALISPISLHDIPQKIRCSEGNGIP